MPPWKVCSFFLLSFLIEPKFQLKSPERVRDPPHPYHYEISLCLLCPMVIEGGGPGDWARASRRGSWSFEACPCWHPATVMVTGRVWIYDVLQCQGRLRRKHACFLILWVVLGRSWPPGGAEADLGSSSCLGSIFRRNGWAPSMVDTVALIHSSLLLSSEWVLVWHVCVVK